LTNTAVAEANSKFFSDTQIKQCFYIPVQRTIWCLLICLMFIRLF